MNAQQARSLLVFADDWGRHPSSCQHLVSQLLADYRVCWVNTIGTRRPSFDLATLSRGFEKLRHWMAPANGTADMPSNLAVKNPWMWPWFTSQRDQQLNRRLLSRQLRPLVGKLAAPVVALTTIPLVAPVFDDLPGVRVVYYCVDDFGQWPGLDRRALERLEEMLIARADVLIAVSETLQAKIAARGRTAHLLTHGVDLSHWSSPLPAEAERGTAGLATLERPVVAFWGLIDRRMDVAFIGRLAADLDRGTILLVGPEASPDPALYASPRVVRLPSMDYRDLPLVAASADVLVMPYADLPVTRAIQPLKMKEYLATGKAVVARRLPATEEWGDALDLVDDAAAFSQLVRQRIETGLPAQQAAARGRLAAESWQAKARELERLALCW